MFSRAAIFFSLFVATIFHDSAFATVRVLSWWGYFNEQNTTDIQKKCDTNLVVDQYYTTLEFLKIFSINDYDVIVYSDTAFNNISQKIITKQKIASNNIKNYERHIKNVYDRLNYPKNTAIFQISITGFLYDKRSVSFPKNASLKNVMNNLQGKLLILPDDHIESLVLLKKIDCQFSQRSDLTCQNNDLKNIEKKEDIANLKKYGLKTFVTNDISTLYNHKNFGAAYSWSGEALGAMRENKNLVFLTDPDFSNISLDIISILNEKEKSVCVANYISSPEFLNKISQKTLYFSPYGKVDSNNSEYLRTQDLFFKKIDKLKWNNRYSQPESKKLFEFWRRLQLGIGNDL